MDISRPFKIFIEVDQPQRDLSGLLFIINLIKGEFPSSSIYLVPRDRIFVLGFLIIPDIVIFGVSQSPYIPFFKFLGSKIVIHENEGIPYKVGPFLSMPLINKLCVSAYWMWGKNQFNKVLSWESIHFPIHKLYVSGGLRYELFKYLPKSSHSGGYQFNTNFPILSPKYQSIYKEVNMLINKHPKDAPSFIEDIPLLAARRERLISFILNLPNDLSIRIRNHPFESSNYYKYAFSKIYNHCIEKKINFIDDTDIHDDLFTISHSFNSGCQTTLDSLVRGVIPVSIENSGNIWDTFSLSLDKVEQFSNCSNTEIHMKLNEFAVSRGIENYLYNFSNNINLKSLIKPLIPRKNFSLRKLCFTPLLRLIGFALIKIIYEKRTSRTTIKILRNKVKKILLYFRNQDYANELEISTIKGLPYLKQ